MNITESSQKNNNKGLHLICRITAIIIGIFLLFSALAKTQPISSFISTIYSHFSLQFTYVTLLAQFIVALEAALGVMIIMGLIGRKRWVLWVTNLLFIVFTVFVIYIWYKDGENADCGCLGDWVKLSPINTLIKNLILIALTTFLLFKYRPLEGRSRHIFTYVILVILFFYTILFYPAELVLDKLYEQQSQDNYPTLTTGQQPDLREGKYILAFMSFGCPHCRTAAQTLSSIYEQDTTIPLIFVFSDKAKDNIDSKQDFFNELSYQDIPTMYMNHDNYVELAGRGVPSIYLITDMVIDKKVDNYKSLDREDIQKWLAD